MDIEEIKKITIKPNERLLVKLPNKISDTDYQAAIDAFNRLFPEESKEKRILLYYGLDLDFQKVEIE